MVDHNNRANLSEIFRMFVSVLVIAFNIQTAHALLTSNQGLALQSACPGYETCFEEQSVDSCCLPCSCDMHVCSMKGNCCPNMQFLNLSEHIGPKTSCVTTTVNLENSQKKLSDNEDSMSVSHLGVMMVTSCPVDANETRCTSPDVTQLNQSNPIYNVDNGMTYRNIFCVHCNNIASGNTTKLKPWKAYVTCSNIDILKSDDLLFPDTVEKIFSYAAKTSDQSCGIDFIPPDGVKVKQDICFEETNVVSDCPEKFANKSVDAACNQFQMPYVSVQENETIVYRNYFCFLCNNEVQDNHRCPADVDIRIHDNNYLVAELNADMKDDSKIVSPWLQADLTPASFIPSGVKCGGSTTFDPYLERCREWNCPNGRHRVGTECVPTFVDVIKATYGMTLKFIPDSLSLNAFKSTNKTVFTYDILSNMFGQDSQITSEIIILSIKGDDSYLYTFVLISMERNSSNKNRIFDQATYGSDVSLLTDNGTITVHVKFAVGIKLELSTYPFSDIVVVDMIDYTALINLYRVEIESIKRAFKYTQISKMAFCTQVVLKRNEIHDYLDLFDIVVSDVRIYSGEFTRTSGYDEVRVCLSDYLRDVSRYLDEKRRREMITPQAIVSVVCNMLSIAGLLGTILTYIIFDELRSIPGKNNMMLAVHLLFAQVLYQFGMDQTEIPKLCIALGVFIHLFWLTAIFWMNACTLHMFRTFVTGQSYRSVRALDPQVCCYALYCYGVAVSMVATNIAVSLYRSDGKDFGYGGRVCYISNPVMVGWVFALPVGVIIILNMGFFLAVVYQISASTMRRRGKSTDRANTVIYMKLSSLTGVTWIFGYLYLWTNFTPLEYIFIVLNAGQGVFIFISFICTQRITKLYRNLFRKYCRSCRENRSCPCARKLAAESEANGVEMNTAKVSLTAASITKTTRMPKRLQIKVGKENGEKSFCDSQTDSMSRNQHSPDVIKDSPQIARQLVKSIPIGDSPISKNEINMDFVNYNTGGAISEGLQNGLNNIAIAAIGLRDIEFISAKHRE